MVTKKCYTFVLWRGGRVVDCGGLENRWAARLRGFESLPLRKTTKQKGIEKSIPFVFIPLAQVYLQTEVWKTKDGRLAAFCAVGLQGPLRRAEGKGVKRSDHRERSSQSLPLRSITMQNGWRKSSVLFLYPYVSGWTLIDYPYIVCQFQNSCLYL